MKNISKMLSLLLLFFCCCGLFACGKATIVSMEIKDGTFATEYFVGDKINFDDIVLVVNYSDKSSRELTINDVQMSSLDNTQAGKQTLTITYNELQFDFDITFKNVELSKIEVKPNTIITEYFEGEDVDTSNLVVVATYNNGTTKDISASDLIISPISTEEGTRPLTITYGNKSTFINITFNKIELVNLQIKSGFNNEYFVGNKVDTSTIIFTATYNNGRKEDVEASDVVFGEIDNSTAQDTHFVVTYGGKQFTFDISFVDAELTEIKVKTLKTTYFVGEEIDKQNAVFTAIYEDGSQKDVTNVIYSNIDNTTEGTRQLTVSYGDKFVNVDITFNKVELIDLKIESGLNGVYYTNRNVDTSNIIFTASYNNGDTKPVTASEVAFGTIDNTTAGLKQFSVNYEGKNFDFDINFIELAVTNVLIKEGTFNTEIDYGSSVDYSNLKLDVTFNDNSNEEIGASDYEIVTYIDTYNVESQKLKVNYDGTDYEFDVTINKPLVSGFALPTYLTTNKNAYKVTTNTYKIGDDNALVFMPNVTALNDDFNTYSLTNFKSDITLEILGSLDYEGVAFTTNAENKYIIENAYLSVNTITQSYKFTSEAVGKTFRLTIGSNLSTKTITFVAEIVDGYNVTNAKELSVLNNSAKSKTAWSSLKQANGIDEDLIVSAIVLHGSITLSDSDFPTSYFYQSTTELPDNGTTYTNGKDASVGCLKMWNNLYNVTINENSSFTIYGNYFTINAQNVSVTTTDITHNYSTNGREDSHSFLFGFNGDNDLSDKNRGKNTSVYIYDLYTLGNTQKESSDTEISYNQGGLGLMNVGVTKLYQDNVVQKCFFNMLVNFIDNSEWEINETRYSNAIVTDAFSNSVYQYGSNKLIIENSEFTNAGGPLIMMAHKDPQSNTSSRYGNLSVTNSKLESYVAGTEIWFKMYSATSTASSLKQLNALVQYLSTGTKSFTKTETIGDETVELFNFICVLLDADNPYSPEGAVKGYSSINLNADEYGMMLYAYNEENSIEAIQNEVLKAFLDSSAGKTSPVFQSSKGGMMYVNIVDGNYVFENLYTVYIEGVLSTLNSSGANQLLGETVTRDNYSNIITNAYAQLNTYSSANGLYSEEITAKNLDDFITTITTIISNTTDETTLAQLTQIKTLAEAIKSNEAVITTTIAMLDVLCQFETNNTSLFIASDSNFIYCYAPAGNYRLGVAVEYFTFTTGS
ncbi:MAG: bacterial Ig-like domain-containing protein [Christensenellales bacterium]